jgi:uncharacterized protein involved in exopolysaccharide biosynthesis
MSKISEIYGQDRLEVITQSQRKALTDRIVDLEAKLAKTNQELAELRAVHRQIANGIRDLGENLIDDTVG